MENKNQEQQKITIYCDVSAIQECFKKWPRSERTVKCAAEIEEYKKKCATPHPPSTK